MRLGLHRDQPSPWAFFADFPRILPYLRPHKRLAGVSLALVAMSAVTSMLSPWPALAGTASVAVLMLLLGSALLVAVTAHSTTAVAACQVALDYESSR